MPYKTIIFDFGGVILNIDFGLTHSAFQRLGGGDLDKKFSQTQQSGFFDDFEKGKISPQQFRVKIKKLLDFDVSDDNLNAAWNKMLLDIPKQRVDWILKLKEKYQCVLLSNTNQIHYDFYRENLELVHGYKKFSDLFHKTYFSHKIGMRKPDANIYDYVLKELSQEPSEVLFIDDTQKNIDAAKALGWNTILWENKELDELL